MSQTFDCPKCGAPVRYERPSDPNATRSTVRCDYCHSQLVAPNELAGQPARVVRAAHGHREDIITFDSKGKVARTIPAAISSASGDSELSMRVAVDGSGFIYALGRFNDAVFKFARDGKFLTRFGGGGDQPGQFRSAYSIAVDGYGRVYVGDMKGIQVFDANGRFLALLELKGMAFGMVFNDKNELIVVARDHVVKFAVPAQ